MVVGLALAAIQMGMALPTGFLFGVGYGTGVRIGYEQVYPLLFPKGARSTTSELAATMKGMNTVYDAIGGKDASRMGIAVGITNAGEILNNPDFQVLEKLELSSSGLTSSSSNRTRFGLDQDSPQQVTSSEIDKFNLDTNAELWILFRSYSITQLRNIITSTTNQIHKDIATKVLNEKFQQNTNTGSGTRSNEIFPPTAPYKEITAAKQPVALAWLKKRDDAIQQFQAKKRDTLGFTKAEHISRYRTFRTHTLTWWNILNRMSRDYRHSNNFIRTQALTLRNLLQTSLKMPPYK